MNVGASSLDDRFIRAMHGLPRFSDQKLVIAFSGGGDSLALLALACKHFAPSKVHALIVDHALRPQSAGEARQAAAMAQKLGAQAQILRWENPTPGQAHARSARYGLLAEACRYLGASTLHLAHTLGDQEETFAIRLSRNSSERGLAAMSTLAPFPVWPQGRGLWLSRPLLGARRTELRRWLKQQNLAWIDDPSNQDHRYARVRARERLAALRRGGLLSGRIANSVDILGDLENERRHQARALLDAAVQFHPQGYAIINHDRFARAASAPRFAALAAVLAGIAGSGAKPVSAQIARRIATRLDAHKKNVLCIAGCRVERFGTKILLSRDPGAVLGRTWQRQKPKISVLAGQDILFDERFELRPAEHGWLEALGRKAHDLPVSQRDTLKSLPAMVRPTLPIIRSISGGISSPLLGGAGSVLFLGTQIAARFLAPFSHK